MQGRGCGNGHDASAWPQVHEELVWLGLGLV